MEKGSVKVVGGDGERFQRGGVLARVHLDKAHKEVDTVFEGVAPDDIVRRRLHDGCFKGGNGFFAEGCGLEVSEGRWI